MAIMQGLTPVRGRLGGTGFRQQTVRTGRAGSGTYRRRTVAFQIQETPTNPNAPGQQRQRTSFALIVALGSALNAKGILPNFYPSGSGLGNFQKFVSDNVLTLGAGGAIVQNPNNPADVYVDFRYLRITRGSITVPVEVYQGDVADTDCDCTRKLAWGFDATQGWPTPYSDWKLLLVGVKIDSTGAIEDIVQSQPCATIDQCVASVTLPKCDCCKTYWYAFFVNPVTGYNTASVYVGTCEGSADLPVYDATTCLACNVIAQDLIPFAPPSEIPDSCGDEAVDMSTVFFNGGSNFANIAGPAFNPVIGCAVGDCVDCQPQIASIPNDAPFEFVLNMDPANDNSNQRVMIAPTVGAPTVFDQLYNNFGGEVDSNIIITDTIINFTNNLPSGYRLVSVNLVSGYDYTVTILAPTSTYVTLDSAAVSAGAVTAMTGLKLGNTVGLTSVVFNGRTGPAVGDIDTLYDGAPDTLPSAFNFDGGGYAQIEVIGYTATCGRKYTYTWNGTAYALTDIIIVDVIQA